MADIDDAENNGNGNGNGNGVFSHDSQDSPSWVRKGILKEIINVQRHKPIAYDTFRRFGIQAISWWVAEFKQDLYPWGGRYRFLQDTSWEKGPILPSTYKYVLPSIL
jgi:hypothetical protein